MGYALHLQQDALEPVLLKMKKAKTVVECRRAVEDVLWLIKERKFERLREELGGAEFYSS